jgi:hypothetical protein
MSTLPPSLSLTLFSFCIAGNVHVRLYSLEGREGTPNNTRAKPRGIMCTSVLYLSCHSYLALPSPVLEAVLLMDDRSTPPPPPPNPPHMDYGISADGQRPMG